MEKRNTIASWLLDYLDVMRKGFKVISRENMNLIAAGMVFSTLIAIVPCVTFLSAFLSAFGAMGNFVEFITEWLVDVFGQETGDTVMSAFTKFTGNALSLGVLGLVSFLVTGMLLVNKVYSVVNHIFHTTPRSGVMKRFMLMLIFLIVFCVAVTFGISLSAELERRLYIMMGVELERSVFSLLLKDAGLLALVVGFFLSILCLLPNTRIRFSSALPGAVLGSILTYVSTYVFTLVVKFIVGFSIIYGSLASLLFLLLFFYIMWYILVFVSEVTYIHQFRPDRNTLMGRPLPAESEIADAVSIMVYLSSRFKNGEGPAMIADMEALEIPSARLVNVLWCLESRSLIIDTGERESAFMLRRPSSSILISDIVGAVFSSEKRGGEGRGWRMASLFSKEGTDGLGAMTLEDIAEKEEGDDA